MPFDSDKLPWVHIYNPHGLAENDPTEDVTQNIPAALLYPRWGGIEWLYTLLTKAILCLCCNLQECCATANQALSDAAAAMARAEEAYALALLGGGGPSEPEELPKDPALQYTVPGFNGAMTTLSTTINRVYYQRISIPRGGILTGVSVEVTAASAGNNVDFGVYSDIGTGLKPQTRLGNGIQSTTTIGKKTNAFAIAVADNTILHLAVQCSAAVTLRGISSSGSGPGYGIENTANPGVIRSKYETPAFGLPVTANTTLTNLAGAAPLITFTFTET